MLGGMIVSYYSPFPVLVSVLVSPAAPGSTLDAATEESSPITISFLAVLSS